MARPRFVQAAADAPRPGGRVVGARVRHDRFHRSDAARDEERASGQWCGRLPAARKRQVSSRSPHDRRRVELLAGPVSPARIAGVPAADGDDAAVGEDADRVLQPGSAHGRTVAPGARRRVVQFDRDRRRAPGPPAARHQDLPARQQNGRVEETTDGEPSRGLDRPRGRVVEFGGVRVVVRVRQIGAAARDEHFPVRQGRQRRVRPGHGHRAGLAPRSSIRVVEQEGRRLEAGGQHFAGVQQHRSNRRQRVRKVSGVAPDARRRVVDLAHHHRERPALPASDQHLAVRQQRRGVRAASVAHRIRSGSRCPRWGHRVPRSPDSHRNRQRPALCRSAAAWRCVAYATPSWGRPAPTCPSPGPRGGPAREVRRGPSACCASRRPPGPCPTATAWRCEDRGWRACPRCTSTPGQPAAPGQRPSPRTPRDPARQLRRAGGHDGAWARTRRVS